jgi:hypothetical protein
LAGTIKLATRISRARIPTMLEYFIFFIALAPFAKSFPYRIRNVY